MKVGLYFGSFNPIHVGHLIIANHVLNNCAINQVWFVVSPHNPLKQQQTLLNEYNRLHLVNLAIADNPKFRSSDIEFKMPRPSYTIDTLTAISAKHPGYEFSVIMGGDSFSNIQHWKNHEVLLANYSIIVYNRPGFSIDAKAYKNVTVLNNAPLLSISSTEIRKLIKQKKSIQYFVPDKVIQEIEASHYYK
ncbi:MAG: nicotinate (nicotinamide) nucleotide adenylyltransferase [Chitinophagaceae bacterium]